MRLHPAILQNIEGMELGTPNGDLNELRTWSVGGTVHAALGSMLVAYTAGMARVVSTDHQTLT